MQYFNGSMWDYKPESVIFNLSSVDVVKSAIETEIKDESTGEVSTKWIVEFERYSYNEYARILTEQNENLERENTSAQVALTELYEMIIGGDL